MNRLSDALDAMTVPASLVEPLEGGAVRCLACAHRCRIPAGGRGVCQVRFNRAGELRVPWGYVAGLQSDPVEKKPFNHLLPGSDALTFGMLGCDFHCDFCQNWISSQALRDPAAGLDLAYIRRITPEQMVTAALSSSSLRIMNRSSPPSGRWISLSWQRKPGCAAPMFPTATPPPKRCRRCALTLRHTRLT